MKDLHVEVRGWDEAEACVMPVRTEVFVVEQGVPAEIERDALDAVCRHAIARDAGGRVVATGRLLPDGHIGRMAVLRAARGADKAMITDVALFDRYQGKGVPEGQVSLAVQVTIQPREATLTDAQIEAVADRVVAAVAKATGAVLRA